MALDPRLFAGLDQELQQQAPPPPPAPKAPGFRDYARLAARGVLREAPLQAASTVAGMIQGPEGVEPYNPDLLDKTQALARTSGEEYAADVRQTLGEGFGAEMVQALPSLGYSAATLPVTAAAGALGAVGGAALGGAAGLPTGPGALTTAGAGAVGGFAAGTAAGFAAMNRAAQAQILGDLAAQEEQRLGRPLSQAEFETFKAGVNEKVAQYGGWEAGPEALSNVIDVAILRRVPGGGLLKGLGKAALGFTAAELPTEVVTQIGQSQALEGTAQARPDGPLSFTSPKDIATATREVLPGVLVVGGGMTVAGAALSAMSRSGETADADTMTQRAKDIAQFKAENPDAEITDAEIATYMATGATTGANVAEDVATAPPAEATPAPPAEVTSAPPAEVTPAPPAEVTPERLGLPAPTNISLPSGDVLPAQQFYRMLNERLDAKAGGMTREEVIRSRRRLAKEEQQFFEIQAIKDLPEAQRSTAEKLKLKKYSQWLEATVPASAVTEQKELVNDLSPMPVTRTETRQEVQGLPVQGPEVTTTSGKSGIVALAESRLETLGPLKAKLEKKLADLKAKPAPKANNTPYVYVDRGRTVRTTIGALNASKRSAELAELPKQIERMSREMKAFQRLIDLRKETTDATQQEEVVKPESFQAFSARKRQADADERSQFATMSRDELYQEYDRRALDESALEERILGADLGAWTKAQRQLNSNSDERVAAAEAAIERIESKLAPVDRDRLYGQGEVGHAAEDLREYINAVDAVGGDTVEELATTLKFAITKLNGKKNPADMDAQEFSAYLQLREGMRQAQEKGLDTKVLSDAVTKAAASRFSDPNDALFMLRDFIKPKETTDATQQEVQEPPVRVQGSEVATETSAGVTVSPTDNGWEARDKEGNVIGELLTEFSDGEGTPERPAFAADIRVKPEWRRKGVASRLMEEFSKAQGGMISPSTIQTEEGMALWEGLKVRNTVPFVEGFGPDYVKETTNAPQQEELVPAERLGTDAQVQGVGVDRVVPAGEQGQGGQAGGGDIVRIQEKEVSPAPASQETALPRLKRGYRRQTFTVADPTLANYTFVEDVSPKGVKTLLSKKAGETEFKPVSKFIADRMASLPRIEAKFSEVIDDRRYVMDSYREARLSKIEPTTKEGSSAGRHFGVFDGDELVETRKYSGTKGNKSHITQTDLAWIPTNVAASLQGAMGEKREWSARGFGNYSSTKWRALKKDIFLNGFEEPIFITQDYGEPAKVSEGNHRIQAAIQLGLTHIPAEIRYFGKSEEDGLVFIPKQAENFGLMPEPLTPIDSLSQEIARETGKDVPPGTFTQVAPPRGQEKVFEALGQTLGKNIIFFEAKNAPMQFSGVTGIVEGTIFININTPRPHLAIAGHEFLHDLKREDPEVYDSLRQTILDTIPAAKREAMWAGLNAKRKSEGRPEIDRTDVDEELIADFFGEQFTTKEFWAKVERRNPEGFAALVQRLVDFLGRIAQAFTGKQREEILRAQDAAAEALARYVKRNPEPTPNPVDPRFSETPKLNMKAAADAVRSGQVTTAALPTALKWMPFRTTVDIFKDTLPQLPAVYEATTQREAMASSIITDFGLIGKELAKTKDTAQRVAAAAEDASFYQMKPQLDLYSQDWIAEAMRGVDGAKPATKEALLKGAQTTWEAAGMQKSTGKTFREAYAESKLSYDALKTDELKEQYLIAVSKMDILRDQMLDEGIRLIESTTEVTEDMPQEQQDRLTALRAEQLTAIRSAYNKLKGNYWPFYRVGDYLLSYVNKETGERESKAFRTVFERDYVAKSLLETGLVDESSMKLTKKEGSTPGAAGIPKGYNDALTKAIEEKAIFEATKGIDPANTEAIEAATKQAIADSALTTQTLQEVWLSFQPETSLAKHQMRRKNIRGWDSDMVRGFLDYGATHAAKISHMRHGRRIDDMIAEMYADVKNRQGDTTREMAVLNDIKARNDMAKKPVASSWLAKALGTATTLKYMTSPSIALVQMTQLGILTLPRLATMRVGGKEVGVTAAANALRKGIQAAFSKNYGRDKLEEVEEIYSLMHSEVTSELRAEQPKYKDVPIGTPIYSEAEIQAMIDKQLNSYQKQLLALQEAMHRGILDISMTHEVIDQIQGGDPNAPHVKLANLMMTFMRESETASRKAAILSAFEVAGGEKDFFAGMEAVNDVVDSTLFNYSKSAKGVMLQGDLMRVLSTFQTFRINAIGKLFTLFRETIKGADPETRTAAKRELIGIFGMSGMLAGALGMPILPIVFKLFDSLVGDDGDEPSEEQFRKWLETYFGEAAAGVALEGLPSLLGVSLSRRIGLGDVVGFGQEAPARLTGSGLANWYATQAMGPSYSMAAGFWKGYDEIFNEGEVMKGLQSSLPKLISDPIKAIGYYTEGVKTAKGKRLLSADQISADEIIFQALGFAPYEISRMKTEEFTRETMGTEISKRRGQVIQDFAKAFMDKEDTTDEREAIKEFNQRFPLFPIRATDLTSTVRTMQMGELGVDTERDVKLKMMTK